MTTNISKLIAVFSVVTLCSIACGFAQTTPPADTNSTIEIHPDAGRLGFKLNVLRSIDRKLAIIYMVQVMPYGDRNYRDVVYEAVYQSLK